MQYVADGPIPTHTSDMLMEYLIGNFFLKGRLVDPLHGLIQASLSSVSSWPAQFLARGDNPSINLHSSVRSPSVRPHAFTGRKLPGPSLRRTGGVVVEPKANLAWRSRILKLKIRRLHFPLMKQLLLCCTRPAFEPLQWIKVWCRSR